MLLDPPSLENGSAQDWFSYFRLTHGIGGFAHKLNEVLRELDTPEMAHRVLTAYCAAALDVVFFLQKADIGDDILGDLYADFEISPATLLTLNAHDMAALMSVENEIVQAHLISAGYKMSDKSDILSFTPQSPAKVAPKGPQGP